MDQSEICSWPLAKFDDKMLYCDCFCLKIGPQGATLPVKYLAISYDSFVLTLIRVVMITKGWPRTPKDKSKD